MHQKHSHLTKPSIGKFARNEWAFIGTNCGAIQRLATEIVDFLRDKFEITYLDADHQTVGSASKTPSNNYFTDKISHHEWQSQSLNSFEQQILFQNQDLVLVNGNHFEANKQLVFLDSAKEASLRKRLHQLTDVQAFIMVNDTPIFDFLKEKLPDWASVPCFSVEDGKQIASFIEKKIQPVPLYGLVLAGGKSQRMGEDKGLLNYHGKSQREHVFEMMQPLCEQVFVSCRADQQTEISLPSLGDSFIDLGAYGAILSAFRHNPNAAWLVMACDMPLVDEKTLLALVEGRNPKKTATAFYNPETNFPEPLLSIWEPKAYSKLLNFLALGYACPRKVLINSDIELLKIKETRALTNANTPTEKQAIMETMG